MRSSIRTQHGVIGLEEKGAGEALPILFLHGVGSDKTVWRPQLGHFGRARRAVAFDFPGYGESDAWPGASRDEFAASIVGAMDALDIPRAHICGLSLGGVIAIAIHAAAPERIASLILADSFAIHPDGEAIYQRSIAASRDMAALAEARVPALVGANASAALRAELEATMARIDPAAFRQGADAVWLADQRARAAGIDVATLVLVGDEDKVTPPALSHELARLIPGATIEIIEGAGHLANIEQPDAFNAAVTRFLDRVESGCLAPR